MVDSAQLGSCVNFLIVVFVLTGFCKCSGPFHRNFLVYIIIMATVCSGLAIEIAKSEVNQFEIDDETEYAVITASGLNVTLKVDGHHATQETSTWLPNVKAIKLIDPAPGTCTATAKRDTESSIYIVGRTDFTFKHGFSSLEPKTINDTTPQPFANTDTHLSISVTDPKHKIKILCAQLLDENDKPLLLNLTLRRIVRDFYVTTPFKAPSVKFRIAVHGKITKNGRGITRKNKVLITPTEPPKAKIKSKIPVVTISEGKLTEVDYGGTTKLTCKVSAYPEPTIEWFNSRGDQLKSETSMIEEPYEYVSYLTITDVIKNDKYSCKARNKLGKNILAINVIAKDPFTITSVPKDVTELQYGVRGTLRCDITAAVPMHISWYLEDNITGASKQLVTSDKYTISNDGTTLNINRMDFDLVGKYTCKAVLDKNQNNFSIHETQVQVTGLTSPNIISSPSVYESIEGINQELKIPCKATGIPKPIITWKVNGKIISSNTKFSIEEGTLVIKDPKVADSAPYTCEAQNDADTVHATFRADIRQLPVVSGDNTVTAIKGLPINLECEAVKGVPKPVISWQFKANAASTFEPLSIFTDELSIPSVGVQHAGSYKCVAHNVVGDDEHITTLTVQVPPTIISNPLVYEAVETRDRILKIPCNATGIPEPTIRWKVKGAIISPNKKFSLKEGTLVIKEPKVADSGTFLCEAQNNANTARAIFRADIRQLPEVFAGDKNRATKGQPFKLKCKTLKGVPKPTISWQFKSNAASTFEALPVYKEVLHIPSVGVQHAGSYKCVAHNVVGDGEHITTLTVQVPPNIISSPSVYEAVEARDRVLKIPCRTTGVPKPTIMWKVKGEIIPSKPDTKFAIEDGTLVIKEPKAEDSDIYTCEAQNEVDTVRATFRADIHQLPQLFGVNEKIAIKSQPVNIECRVIKGVPQPTLSWQFKPKGASTFAPLPIRDNVLQIPRVSVQNAGSYEYKCVAHNVVGEVELITTLTVQVPPNIISNLSVYEGVETRDRVLKIPCKATGIPEPNIAWKVKGAIISPNIKFSIEDGTLVIREPKVTDSEIYTCVAQNDAETASTTFRVDIHQLPEVSAEHEITVTKDLPVNLECEAIKGIPKPTISWEFKRNGGSAFKPLLVYNNVLRIPSVGVQHAGSYKCIAHNVVGDGEHITTLTVHVPPNINSSPSVYEAVETKDRVLNIACKASGIPKPIITWKLNGVIISSNTKYAMEEETLIIKEPKVADSGSYSCEAKNVVDIARATFRADIRQLPELSGENEKTAIKGQPVNLECKAFKGVPEPTFSWQFKHNATPTFEPLPISDNVLRIPNVGVQHTGSYKCIAHNIVGDGEHITTLNVFVPPNIILSPSVFDGVETRDRVLTITCKATGVPKPIITWKVKGAIITSNTKFSIEDGNLVIKDPKVTDCEIYTCEAQNAVDTVTATFRAEINQLPELSGENETIAIKGRPVNLVCKVLKGVPKPNISWQFKSNTASAFEVLPEHRNVLRITHVGVQHAGSYKCIAHNVVGDNEHITTLTVHVPPTIISNPSVYEAIETRDQVLKIPCKAIGNPNLIITWKVKGAIISPNPKFSIEEGTLVINKPKVADSELYTCEAKNDAGSVNATFRVDIHQLPEASGVNEMIAIKGESVNLECKALRGVPKPTISWQFKPIAVSTFERLTGFKDVLRIPSVDVQHAGSYKCVAQNIAGDSEHITTLTVHVPPIITSNSSLYECVEEKDRLLKIPCQATGLPMPIITWKLRGAIIPSNDTKFSIEDGTLVIKEPKVADSDTYTCQAQNVANTASATFRVIIRQLPEVYAEDTKIAIKGQPINLECETLKGVPEPTISWQFKPNAAKSFELSSVHSNVLRIPSADVEHAGSYKCVAHNAVGDAEHITTLIVFVPPTIISSSYIFEAVETRDRVLKIPCKTTGIPKPIITWKVKGAVLFSNQKFLIKNGTLVINEPYVTDSQIYTCEARNGAGSTLATFQVNILQTPEISGNSVQTARRGHFANIECKVIKGVPKPTITWQFQAKSASRFVPIHRTGGVLNILTVGEAHAGRYKCIASNHLGHDEHLTELIVEFTPVIISNSTTIYGIEGDAFLRIPCDTVGVPEPVVTWKVGDATITTPNEHYVIINGSLLIRDPMESDSNFYTCEAKNHIGVVYGTFRVYVSSELEEFGTIHEINVLEGTTFDLECGSDGSSQSVRWYKGQVYTGVEERYYHFEKIPLSLEGNYTCHVSDINGARTETTVVMVGFLPRFENPPLEGWPLVDWSGTDLGDELDCTFSAKPPAIVVWSLNGKVLSTQNSSRLVVPGDWGHYTCNVSNIHGSIQRSFDVMSTQCLIRRKPYNMDTMPLILSSTYTWPVLNSNIDYLIVKPEDTIIFSCPDFEDKINFVQNTLGMNEITTTCVKQDVFKVEDVLYRLSDFYCAQPVHSVVVSKHEKCLGANSKVMRVGHEVHGFLETYEVCFDVFMNMALYSRAVMSKSNRGGGHTYSWHKYPGLGSASGDTLHTCTYATSSCCYSKTQLVNARDVSDGPPQKSTFIDPLNAVPLWLPCAAQWTVTHKVHLPCLSVTSTSYTKMQLVNARDVSDAPPQKSTFIDPLSAVSLWLPCAVPLGESPWASIEDTVRSRLDSYDQFVVWSGTHKLQHLKGSTIPRYLWKVVRFAADDTLAMIYVNGPSPSPADILCRNICADNKIVPWIHEHDDHTYCCQVDKFLRAFGLSATTVGEPL